MQLFYNSYSASPSCRHKSPCPLDLDAKEVLIEGACRIGARRARLNGVAVAVALLLAIIQG